MEANGEVYAGLFKQDIMDGVGELLTDKDMRGVGEDMWVKVKEIERLLDLGCKKLGV